MKNKPTPPLINEPIPAVCLIDDVARWLRTSRRTIERLRRHGAFPIKELPPIDKRARWSGVEIQKYLDGKGDGVRGRFCPKR